MDPAAFQFLTGRPWGQADQERSALAGYVDRLAADNRRREEERNARIREALGQTWPAQMVKSAVSAMALPGDVYAGRVDPNSDEAIGRSADLAGLLTFGAGAAPAARNELRMGIKAYHGSPHDFDRFDMSKIGTGEGAQAYGHGLYFAGNEAVAQTYKGVQGRASVDPMANVAAKQLAAYGDNTQMRQMLSMVFPDATPDQIETAINTAKAPPSGRMYEVELNTTPDRLLDWDKPLYEQTPHAQGVLKALGIDPAPKGGWSMKETSPGRWTVYNVWGERAGTFKDRAKAQALVSENTRGHNVGGVPLAYQKLGGNHIYSRGGGDTGVASAKLKEAGIDGIQYLDAGSRMAGEGSRNYVMFDDRLVKILRKYGVAGVSALPAAALAELGLTREEAERMY